MEKQRMKTFRMVFLAMMVAIGVVISPILRIEGMCPTAHLINITCSVFMGPWYSLLCACMIGVIRMMFMGIPPLALTGAVFGAFLSGVFYRASKGKIICAVLGEIFGTGIIGSLVSYPVMAFLMGREGLNAFYYTPMFISATIMGGIAAYVFLKALSQTGMLAKFQESLGAKVYDRNHRKKQTTLTQKQDMLEIRRLTKDSAPLIHCITNPISIHDCANIILAAGARPIMAEHPDEVEEITAEAAALMLNLGNITDARIASMQRALKAASQRNIPVLLDLVGVTCSRLRRDFARSLLSSRQISIIKGNISEILAAAELPFHGTGIDAGIQDAVSEGNETWYCETARQLASYFQCTVMATGKQDLIANATEAFLVSNGHTALSGITGTGCMVGALTAAYLPGSRAIMQRSGSENDRNGSETTAALLGAITMGLAGELAAAVSRGPGSFQAALLDEIYCLTDEQLLSGARVRMA